MPCSRAFTPSSTSTDAASTLPVFNASINSGQDPYLTSSTCTGPSAVSNSFVANTGNAWVIGK